VTFENIKEAIAEEKAKLIAALPAHGTAVLNRDDPFIRQVAERTDARVLWFGESEEADLRLVSATSNHPRPLTLTVAYEGREYACPTQLHGTHLATAALTALGIGIAAGMSIERAIKGLGNAVAPQGRMQIFDGGDGVVFMRDDFKAPHWTLETNYEFLRDSTAQRKVAVIGTLSDYSQSASKIYPKVARRFREVADLVVFVGPHALRALKARKDPSDSSFRGFTDIKEANAFLQNELRAGDLVLLKGTNRVDHLIRILLSRHRNVSCWVPKCGLNRFCDVCEFIDRGDATHDQKTAIGADAVGEERQAMSDSWLVVGLRNPGPQYENTAHNIGAAVLDEIVTSKSERWEEVREGQLSRLPIAGSQVYFLKPGTPINKCGDAVADACNRLGVSASRVVVVHDDIDLPLTKVRTKENGSDGGHKGLRSVFASLANDGFMPRIRVGVKTDDNPLSGDTAEQVLTPFTPEQQETVAMATSVAAANVLDYLSRPRGDKAA